MKKVVLHISGVSNTYSAIQLEKALRKKETIKSAMMDVKKGILTVNCDETLKIQEIEKYIEDFGYESLGVELLMLPSKASYIPLLVFGVILIIFSCFSLVDIFYVPFDNLFSFKVKALLLIIIMVIFLLYSLDVIVQGILNIFKYKFSFATLATISIFSSTFCGFYNLFSLKQNTNALLYLAMTLFLIYFIKIGKFLQEKNIRSIEMEISQMANTKINKVNRREQDAYHEVNIEDVRKGDTLLCLPGDKVLLDGTLCSGSSHFDEAFLSGKSLPEKKVEASEILSGSINYENEVEYVVKKTIKNCTVSEIKKLVAEEKSREENYLSKLDRFCEIFVSILFLFLITIVILSFLFKDFNPSIIKILSICIACCPFGLVFIKCLSFRKINKFALQKQILIKEENTLEKIPLIDVVVFDKTGTLTNGYLSISKINNHSDMDDKQLLSLLGSIEKHSTHALARGITKFLRSEKIPSGIDFITEDLPGYGVKAKDDEDVYYACSVELLKRLDIINPYEEEEKKLRANGNSVIYLVKNTKVIATFGLKDMVKKEAKKVVSALQEKKLEVVLLTGDDKTTAMEVAKELGIHFVEAEVDASFKSAYLKKILKETHEVMMIGDGINDAPALATATVGVCLKNTSDVPLSAADIILKSSNLIKILDLFSLSKLMMKSIRQNLWLSILLILLVIILSLEIIPGLKWSPVLLFGVLLLHLLLLILNIIRIKNK